MQVIYKPQSEFPLLSRFSEKFKITERTIFAYNGIIYTNEILPNHLIVHEQTHHKQQEKDGLDYWVENYLNDNQYRLKQEIEAYRNQLESIKDRNLKTKVWIDCAKNLSSELYGSIINYNEALNILK